MAEEKSAAPSKRSILSQILAGLVQNLILLDIGIAVSYSTLVIPALLGAEGNLSFTKTQASWFGSSGFILQPIGSLLSGLLLEPLGRKKSLVIVNVIHILGWLLMYFGQNVETIFLASAFLGIGTGFAEAPVITYVGEITQPSIRGTLITLSQVFVNAGLFMTYFLGFLLEWKHVALSCLSIPIITILASFFIPETPVWLISKGRTEEAMKALCWLRGWTEPEQVRDEFEDLVIYQKNSKMCKDCPAASTVECVHKQPGFVNKMKRYYKIITRREMRRPIILIFFMFLFRQAIGIFAIRPNMINIYRCFGLQAEAYVATVITGTIGVLGITVLMLIIKKTGKRPLIISSLILSLACTTLLGFYAYIMIPKGTSSYDIITVKPNEYSWISITLFIIYNIAAVGIGNVPWIMISEVFPLRGRGIACGITAASSYILEGIFIKTHYNLETLLGIHGVFWFYSCLTFLGFVILYILTPETEGKRFQEIENEFSGENTKIIADDFITNGIRKLYKNRKNTKIGPSVNRNTNISTIENEINGSTPYVNETKNITKL